MVKRKRGTLFQKLVLNMGESGAYKHVEKVLRLHAHSAKSLDAEEGGARLQPWEDCERALFERLGSLNKRWDLGVEIEDVSKRAHSGDVIVRHGSMLSIWDSKAYTKKVPWSEVVKLSKDVRVQGGVFGVIVASNGVCRCETYVVCEGVPIHICQPRSPMEFACLYLTTISSARERDATYALSRIAKLFATVESMQENVNTMRPSLRELRELRELRDSESIRC